MINLESESDIRILMNFAKVYKDENSHEPAGLTTAMIEFTDELIEIKSLIKSLVEKVEDQEKIINQLQQQTKQTTVVKQKNRYNNKDDVFTPYQTAQIPYDIIKLDDENLIHIVTRDGQKVQTHSLPINVFELLSIIERFKKNREVLYGKDVTEFCSLFGINRQQFSKIYYNITLGTFDEILTELNNMISRSSFLLRENHLFRDGHDTKITKQSFRDLANIYINSEDQLLAICKLVHEKRGQIDSFDLFTSLKNHDSIFKAFGDLE